MPSLESGAKDAGLYLYCFTRSEAVREIGSAAMKEGQLLGAIKAGGVAAVFSLVPLAEYGQEGGRKNFQDPAWVVPRAWRHDRVIKQMMEFSPVLPVRFGAVFTSSGFIQDQLAKNGPEISWFLDQMSNKEEWSVNAFGHLEKTCAWLLRTDPELLQKSRRAPASPGRATCTTDTWPFRRRGGPGRCGGRPPRGCGTNSPATRSNSARCRCAGATCRSERMR